MPSRAVSGALAVAICVGRVGVDQASPSVAPTSISPAQTPAPAPTTYVVQQGDTLNCIAQQFGTTVEAIRQANGLPSDVINIGQVLIIP